MNLDRYRGGRSDAGQVLVIVAVGMVAFIAMVGLVIDGGNAWGQQRETQNGADSAAKAGTTVIQQMLTGATVDRRRRRLRRRRRPRTPTASMLDDAEYTEFDGSPMGVAVGACGIVSAPSRPVPRASWPPRSQEFQTVPDADHRLPRHDGASRRHCGRRRGARRMRRSGRVRRPAGDLPAHDRYLRRHQPSRRRARTSGSSSTSRTAT